MEGASDAEDVPAVSGDVGQQAAPEAAPPAGDEADPPEVARTRQWKGSLGVAAPVLVEIGIIAAAGSAVFLAPGDALGSLLLPGISALVAVAAMATGLVRERRSGIGRMVDSASAPIAALAIAGAQVLEGGGRLLPVLALALLAVERLGRLLEMAGRARSGVLDVILGAGPSLLASEWRDNSVPAARVRRVAIFLEWARFPLAAGTAFLAWTAGSEQAGPSVLAGAVTLMALNPRVLRMTTGDAHLTVALEAARRGVVIRDAHAVHRVGTTRVVLFMARRTLLEKDLEVVDWQVVDGGEERRVAAALWEAESGLEGRFAAAITGFLSRRYPAGRGPVEAEAVPGKGIKADTSEGRIVCGTREVVMDEGLSTAPWEEWAAEVEKTGRRAFFVALDGAMAAIFAVEEKPIPGVVEVMRELAIMGFDPAITTTAEVDAATALGARMGIDYIVFDSREEDLDSVLHGISASGERVLLVGKGRAFEENLRTATAAMALGSEGHSMAGVDARGGRLDSVVRILASARSARRSVVANLAVALVALGIGVGLATNWHYAQAVVLTGALASLSSAFSTYNGPYRTVGRIRAILRKGVARMKRFLRRGRRPSS